MSEPIPVPARPRDSALAFVVFVGAIVLSLWFTHAGWTNRLFDTHPFRQTQTALSAFWMLRDGVRLDYSTPVMGAPWSIPMEFPFYQAAITAVVRVTGMPLESAGRTVSLFFFYASLPGIWLLTRRLGVGAAQRWLFLALVLVSPVYVFYSRTFLIESTAFCFGIWFLYAFHVSLQTRHRGDILVAAGLGIASGLAKVTTFAIFLTPAAAFTFWAIARNRPMWRAMLARACAAAVPGVVAAIAWIYYTDGIKRRNVFGVMMTSAEQHDWNYGPFSLRFDPIFWKTFGLHFSDAIAPTTTLLLFGALAALFLRMRWRAAVALVVIAFAGPLVFANLYFVHDYYLYASGVFFLAGLSLPLMRLFELPTVGWLGRWIPVFLVLAAQIGGYFSAYYPRQIAVSVVPELFQAVQLTTRPNDVVVGFGMNWSSVIPYYTERRAVMVPDRYARDDAAIAKSLANLGTSRVGAVIMQRLVQPGPEFYAPWLKKLGMDENPFMQTGEYSVFLRKDMLPDALKALAKFPFKDVLLYGGALGPSGTTPPLVYWADQVPDHRIFSMMSPEPTRVTVPFGIAAEILEGRYVFTAHSTSEVEIHPVANSHHIVAEFGLNRAVYDRSDGIEVVIIHRPPNAGPQELYRRYLRPAVLKEDQGVQQVTLETTAPLDGAVVFRIQPGGGPNFDWAYWAKIEIR